MKESQEQWMNSEHTSEQDSIDIESNREDLFRSAYQNVVLEEKILVRENDQVNKELQRVEEKIGGLSNRLSNELVELGLSRDEYQYELSKDNVMRDLEKDVQKRKQEKLLYAASMVGITVILLVLPLFFRQKDDNLSLSSNSFVSESFASANSSSSSSSSSVESSSSSFSQSTSPTASVESPPSSAVQEPRFAGQEFLVQVSVTDLNIRSEPQDTSNIIGNCPPGTYTIVETHRNNGYTWGKLKSRKGWIVLEYTDYLNGASKTKVDTKNLTTQQVKNWVRAAYEQHIAPYANVGPIREIDVRKEQDDLVYARVYENQFNADFLFRVSAEGYLEMQQAEGQWRILSREYVE